jgi:hypothetical protein
VIVCGKCGKPVAECPCPDQDARLRAASDSDVVMFKWCRKCDRHYARCKCSEPDFGIRIGGQWHPPEYLDDGVTLDGTRVQIDPRLR